MMCSGAIVFFDSCSHISFASEDIRCMNSVQASREARQQVGYDARRANGHFTYTTLDYQIPRLLRARNVVGQQFCAGRESRQVHNDRDKWTRCSYLRSFS